MTEEETGVAENVADSQDQQVDQESNQSHNWQAAREALAQKTNEVNTVNYALEEARREIDRLKSEMSQSQQYTDPDDYATVGHIQNKEKQIQQRFDYLEARMTHSDYDDVINNYYSEIAREKPHLHQSIKDLPNASLLAYELGSARKLSKSKAQNDVQRIIDNSKKPASINGAVGGGASPMSHAEYISSMTREQFEQYRAKIKNKS